MKRKILMLAVSGLMGTIVLTSCGGSEQKVENAAENVVEAQKNLDEAEIKYAEEWEKFQLESDERIRRNENDIITYREREKTDSEFSKRYKNKINELETKNSDMKNKINTYKIEKTEKGNERWDEFKREFNHDMDELGTAIKDLGKDNKK